MFDLLDGTELKKLFASTEKLKEMCGLQIMENQLSDEEGFRFPVVELTNELLSGAENGDPYASFAIYALGLWASKKAESAGEVK